jgi:predicted dehydrogenase
VARIGIVGCGNISGVYLATLRGHGLVGVYDPDLGRSHRAAEAHGVAAFPSYGELLAGVDVVVNLTPPGAHEEVTMAALRSGRHAYSEKPLATSSEGARSLVEAARSAGLALGCAPDTVLGAGVQSCRAAMDSGLVGDVVSGAASMQCPGHESWHPDPDFYYKPGGGPLWDMGPYYLSALVCLLGPVSAVQAVGATPRKVRSVGSGPRAGQAFTVETPTTLTTLLEFASGPCVCFSTSFDVQSHTLPHIELYGSLATLSVPDPNGFDGPGRISSGGAWADVPVQSGVSGNQRGLGVLEMLEAHAAGRPPVCSAEAALHVVEVVEAAHAAAASGSRRTVESRPGRPAPFAGLGQ